MDGLHASQACQIPNVLRPLRLGASLLPILKKGALRSIATPGNDLDRCHRHFQSPCPWGQ